MPHGQSPGAKATADTDNEKRLAPMDATPRGASLFLYTIPKGDSFGCVIPS